MTLLLRKPALEALEFLVADLTAGVAFAGDIESGGRAAGGHAPIMTGAA